MENINFFLESGPENSKRIVGARRPAHGAAPQVDPEAGQEPDRGPAPGEGGHRRLLQALADAGASPPSVLSVSPLRLLPSCPPPPAHTAPLSTFPPDYEEPR